MLAVGKPSSRPRLAPWITSPETNQGAPRSSVASTTLPWLKRRAHRARGNRPALVLERRHDVDRETEPRALFRQIGRRAGALVAEMEIEADRRAADAETADQDALDEIFRRSGGELRVEIHDDGAVEPARRQEAQLVARA